MRNQRILRRLEMLERVFAVETRDDWIDIVMWNTSHSGIFGHTHWRFSESRRQTEWTPCSDAEEIEIMREHYEEDGHRDIKSTMLYIQLEQALFQTSDEFHVAVANTVEEACKLVEAGFEYVTEIHGVKIFRKRK